eukprot:TRINITY_DN13866_c0_g1_i1.p1 TRINITY_DN13866_c0_g1~~TRINITY_DN13866_c0_g1_i1.p1  ORF type:complete len:638 (-),score=115.85 TRINITY_DN13866_c0_g1_i1:398-2311(-)
MKVSVFDRFRVDHFDRLHVGPSGDPSAHCGQDSATSTSTAVDSSALNADVCNLETGGFGVCDCTKCGCNGASRDVSNTGSCEVATSCQFGNSLQNDERVANGTRNDDMYRGEAVVVGAPTFPEEAKLGMDESEQKQEHTYVQKHDGGEEERFSLCMPAEVEKLFACLARLASPPVALISSSLTSKESAVAWDQKGGDMQTETEQMLLRKLHAKEAEVEELQRLLSASLAKSNIDGNGGNQAGDVVSDTSVAAQMIDSCDVEPASRSNRSPASANVSESGRHPQTGDAAFVSVSTEGQTVGACCSSVESCATSSNRPKPDVQPSLTSKAMDEVRRIVKASTPAQVLGIPEDADDVVVQKAWKRLALLLHPDRFGTCAGHSEIDVAQAAEALHMVRIAKEKWKETAQAAGLVEVPDTPEALGRPVCTKMQPGQRRFECKWVVPERVDHTRPVENYEVFGPRIFAHTGEPMEWVLLATLPRLEGCFMFVEDSPSQQEVMWAGDRMRVPSLPLAIYGCNGRGRSDPPLYIHLPWQAKFPWLQGLQSILCRHCCVLQARTATGKSAEKLQCVACAAWLSPEKAAVVVRCPKCHGETLWEGSAGRLDCRVCGRHVATSRGGQPPSVQQRTHSLGPAMGGGSRR